MVAGRNSVTVGKKNSERAEKLYLHYAQRWAKDYLRRRLDWVVEDVYGRQDYGSNTSPRHIKGALCPCQVYFILIMTLETAHNFLNLDN